MPNGVNDKVNDGVNVHVNERQKELLSYLLQDPGYTVTQLSEIMSVSRKNNCWIFKSVKGQRNYRTHWDGKERLLED